MIPIFWMRKLKLGAVRLLIHAGACFLETLRGLQAPHGLCAPSKPLGLKAWQQGAALSMSLRTQRST